MAIFACSEQTLRPGPKVALVQGSIDIEMKYDARLAQQIFNEYFGLSRRAVEEHPDLDLIVWPETMYRDPWYTFAEGYEPPRDAEWTPAEIEARSRDGIAHGRAPAGRALPVGHRHAALSPGRHRPLQFGAAGRPPGARAEPLRQSESGAVRRVRAVCRRVSVALQVDAAAGRLGGRPGADLDGAGREGLDGPHRARHLLREHDLAPHPRPDQHASRRKGRSPSCW